MSLINDALKRAKQVQNPSPAPHIPGPPASAADATESENETRGGLFGTMGLVTVVIIGMALLWLSLRGSSHEPETVQARTQDAPVVAEKPSAPMSVSNPAPLPATSAPTEASSSTPATATTAAAVHTANSVTGTVSGTKPPVVEAVATPPPLKLQAVVYSPRRPSAIINGRTLFIGDRIQELRVVAITTDSVTLAGVGTTTRLRLGN